MAAKKTHCKTGHERTPENLSHKGKCLPCRRIKGKAATREKRLKKGLLPEIVDFERVDCTFCKAENCNRCDWSGYILQRTK